MIVGIGATPPVNYADYAAGGAGGYAGIHVPGAITDTNGDGRIDYSDITMDENSNYNSAVLNISGGGTLIAIGGNASDGGTAVSGNGGGGGGGGAGAGIGGNGGKGGNTNAYPDGRKKELNGSGMDGEAGENCGLITIKNATVYAYGGGGGSSGIVNPILGGSGSGAGGYPGAGIGGGGAGGGGGDHANGAGGYTQGIGEDASVGTCATNGCFEVEPELHARWGNGGSYYVESKYDGRAEILSPGHYGDSVGGYIGGQGGRLGKEDKFTRRFFRW